MERMDHRPAVVTGASGFIGRHLVSELLRRERPTTAITRDRSRIRLEHPLLQIVEGSFFDPALLSGILTPESTLFHLAASRGLPARDSSRFRRVNLDQTLALARQCCGRVWRFVNVSTAMIFGPTHGQRADETLIHPPMGNAYIDSRRAACIALESLLEVGLPLVSVLPTIVYGPDQQTNPNRIMAHVRRLLRTPIRLRIGRGEARRTLVEVEDVVQGVLRLELAAEVGEQFILGGTDASQNELDSLALRIARRRQPLTLPVPGVVALLLASMVDGLSGFPRESGMRARIDTLLSGWCFSSEKATERFGFYPKSLEEGVGRMIDAIGTRKSIGKVPAAKDPHP